MLPKYISFLFLINSTIKALSLPLRPCSNKKSVFIVGLVKEGVVLSLSPKTKVIHLLLSELIETILLPNLPSSSHVLSPSVKIEVNVFVYLYTLSPLYRTESCPFSVTSGLP